MAKELPYFKFEPSEYLVGSIQLCTYEAQGIFINICALYWSRLGDLQEIHLQKICKSNAHAYNELMQMKLIAIDEHGNVSVDFLNEQLEEFEEIRVKRRKAAKKRWSSQTNAYLDASALQTDMQNDAIKKRREEKRREESNTRFNFSKALIEKGFDKDLVEDYLKNRKTRNLSNTKTAFEGLIREMEKTNHDPNELFRHIVESGWGAFKASWEVKLNGHEQPRRRWA